MKNVKINGLDEECVGIILSFMYSKLKDENYIRSIEYGGNDCDMDWMEDGMDISGEDMLHELFEMYGEEDDDGTYTLKINDNIFETYKEGENWYDEYYVVS